MLDTTIADRIQPQQPAPYKAWHRLEWTDPRRPAGVDGQGWNRLSIFPMTPRARCELQPRTRQAALDTLRGLSREGNISAYDDCSHPGDCASCPVATRAREQWHPDFCVREDYGGRVWLIGTVPVGFGGLGYVYNDWKSLMAAYDVPRLKRERDATGFYWIQAVGAPQQAQKAA